MKSMKSFFKDEESITNEKTDERIVAKIKAGETLTKDELTHATVNWSPIKQARYLASYAISKTKRG